MLWYTHLAFGFLFGLLVMPFVNTGNIFVYFFFVLFGSLFPDVDEPRSKINKKLWITKVFAVIFRHRGFTHTIYFALITSGVVYYFLSRPIGIAIFIGFLSHLFADSLTVMGVNYLHPFATMHHRGFVETGTPAEVAIFVGIIILSIWMVFF